MNLKSLSLLLGLSQTTVSRALNGYPEVGETTRLRVQEAARLNNYRPNPRATGLATGRAKEIGHIIPFSDQSRIGSPEFSEFIAGAAEVYSSAGYTLALSLVADADVETTYRNQKLFGTVDGVVVHYPAVADPRIPLLTEIGLPFVVWGRSSLATLPYAWVDMNNARAFAMATTYLLDLGHRRIAFLNGPEHQNCAYSRLAGYKKALGAKGLPIEPDLIRHVEMTMSAGHDATKDLGQLSDPPSAIVTSSCILAIGAKHAIEEAGLVLGEDVSIVTHDDDLGYLGSDDHKPMFTCARSSARQAGKQTAELMLSLIQSPNGGVRTRLLRAEFIVGTSTGPAKTGAVWKRAIVSKIQQ